MSGPDTKRCGFPSCSIMTAPGRTYCRSCRGETRSTLGRIPPNRKCQILAEGVGDRR